MGPMRCILKLSMLVALVGMFLLFVGCPPPEWYKIKWLVGKKWKDKITLPLPGQKTFLTIEGGATLNRRLMFRIIVTATYGSEARHFMFSSSALNLTAPDFHVSRLDSPENYQPDYESTYGIVPYNSHSLNGMFDTEAWVGTQYDSTGHIEPINLILTLDGYINYKGQAVPIDTLFGKVH